MIVWALIRMEVDAARPWWGGVFAALGLLLLTLTFEPSADRGLSNIFSVMGDWDLTMGLLVFGIGHATVAREYTEGQIEFLDGLPIHRWQVFFAKCVAVMAPALLLSVGTTLIVGLMSWGYGLPEAAPVGSTLAVYGLKFAVVLFAYASLGMLGSWAGGLGWVALAMFMMAGIMLMFVSPTSRPYLLYEGLLQLSWNRGTPEWLVGPLALWGVVGTGCMVVSGGLYLGPGRWLVTAGTWASRGVRVVGFGTGLLVFVAAFLVALFDVLGTSAPRLFVQTARHDTEHFRFLYPVQQESAARLLMDEAEALNATLAREMHDTEPLSLDIELLDTARSHAGRFLGGKIRMGLKSGSIEDVPDDGRRSARPERETLVHELAHAHAHNLRARGRRHFHRTRFFEEGLATYYANRVLEQPPDRRWAALVWASDQARFDLLVEDEHRGRLYDADQAYPLGEVFVAALIEEHGDEAVACVLRELGAVDDQPMSGLALWVTVTRACDQNLDAVVARYRALLEQEAESLPSLLPVLSAVVTTGAAWMEAEPGLKLPEGDEGGILKLSVTQEPTNMRLSCRFRSASNSPREQWTKRSVNLGHPSPYCRVPGDTLGGTTFQYQLGYKLGGHDRTLYTRWITGDPRAAR